ncbi:MAG: ROK family protein [Oscillospiraceae bacterium]|nr:ROK family protein [Oscillospiraceae bacterium]
MSMYIGIDLGGTNIAGALVDADGVIQKRFDAPTNASGGAFAVLEGIMKVCQSLVAEDSPPLSIGIGVPGAVKGETGDVIFTPNVPLSGLNIADYLRTGFSCPIYLANDANCAALGETLFGGAKDAQNVVFITLGTGVGSGIVLGGRLHTGVNDAAGELGHMVIAAGGRECGCGRFGCWESYASATGLVLTANEFIGTHQESALSELSDVEAEKLDGRLIFDAFRSGDSVAALVVDTYIEHLAVGVVNIINILEPDIICLGGGISNSWDVIAEPLQKAVDAEHFLRNAPGISQTRIVKATLGNDAGIIGAAMLGR